MSSTVGIQNYLSNVFRPVYTFDTVASTFTPKLELSNIDTYSGNTISVFTAAIGDSNNNVYVGSNAGNVYNVTKNVFNTTALGYGAASNISNDCNSVYIGYYAGKGSINSKDVISIGANSSSIGGVSNVFIGTDTGTAGNSNILIGHYIRPTSLNNQIRIGLRNQIPIAADVCTNWVGLGGPTAPVFTGDGLDVSGSTYILGSVGINTRPGVNGTLDVNGNFYVNDGEGVLRFNTPTSNTELTLSNYAGGTSLFNVVGSTQSSTGFWSSRGSNTLTSPQTISIGVLKKGIVLVSAMDNTVSSYFDSKMSIVLDTTTPVVSNLSSNSAGGVSITFTANSINLYNGSGVSLQLIWSITYFPVP
jgi:hypothetical protein